MNFIWNGAIVRRWAFERRIVARRLETNVSMLKTDKGIYIASYARVDDMLYSGSIHHCQCSKNKPHCDPGNWSERYTNTMKKGI